MSKGDKDRTTNKKTYDENYDRIFSQQTEEEYYKNIECVTIPKKLLIERLMEKLNKKYSGTLKSLKDKS